jgi:hypothetical protein
MSDDPKNFLQRWSERKRNASESTDAPSEEKPPTAADASSGALASPAEVEFDPATLPSLESIDGDSDIRAFLQRGVPQALSRAALRRAWSGDPSIRDFVGLSENAWNFNAPETIPGFGTLEPEDVRRAAAQLLGEPDVAVPPAGAPPDRHPLVQTASTSQELNTSPLHEMRHPPVSEAPETSAAKVQPVQKDNDAQVETGSARQIAVDDAAQHKQEAGEYDAASARHRHGGALPK